jgi:hypothetical protein
MTSAATSAIGRGRMRPPAVALNASRNSAALEKRCAGSLASARASAAETGAGTSRRNSVTGFGVWFRCAAITARAERPVNGGTPASSSKATTASE